MTLPWKWLLGAAVLLPVLAYLAGAVVASGDRPTERTPIVVEEPTDAPVARDPETDLPAETDDDDDDGPTRPEVVRPDPRTAQGGTRGPRQQGSDDDLDDDRGEDDDDDDRDDDDDD